MLQCVNCTWYTAKQYNLNMPLNVSQTHGRNLLYSVQKVKASKLHEMQLWCAFNANVYEYHIHHWWFSILCCGSMVATFSVTFLQCHLMSWVWPLQSVLLLQVLGLMAEGKRSTTVSRPLICTYLEMVHGFVCHPLGLYICTTITPHCTCPWVLYHPSSHGHFRRRRETNEIAARDSSIACVTSTPW